MSDVNVSFRHLKKLSDLPPKLTRGRIYFVDDVEYYVIDHGAGPVYYGKKDAERLGLLEGRATELEKRATNVEKRATDLESRATNVEKRATDLEGRAAKVEGRATSLEGRMKTAEGDIDAVENRATALEGRAATLEGRADGHDNADKALQDRATSLEGRMKTAEGDIDAVENRATALEGRAKTLESRADGHDAADTALQGRAKTLEDDLNTANTGLKARMTKAEGNISTNASNISTNANDIATLKSGKADKATTLAGYGITDAFKTTTWDLGPDYFDGGSGYNGFRKWGLDEDHVGRVYRVAESFTTTSDFVCGAGKTYPAGTKIITVKRDGKNKFDVLDGDLTVYAEKADTYTKTETDGNFAKLVYVNPKFEALETRAGELEVATCYKGAWATGKAYKVHDIVTYNGNVYICCNAHTSSTGTAPGSTYNWLAMTANVPTDVFGYNTEGLHNSIYRGKNLGKTITDEQWAEIKAGTFRDLWLGDYWTIPIKYELDGFKEYLNSTIIMNIQIWDFDYFYHPTSYGGEYALKHHILCGVWQGQAWGLHTSNDNTEGFAGTYTYTDRIPAMQEGLESVLGADHLGIFEDDEISIDNNGNYITTSDNKLTYPPAKIIYPYKDIPSSRVGKMDIPLHYRLKTGLLYCWTRDYPTNLNNSFYGMTPKGGLTAIGAAARSMCYHYQLLILK